MFVIVFRGVDPLLRQERTQNLRSLLAVRVLRHMDVLFTNLRHCRREREGTQAAGCILRERPTVHYIMGGSMQHRFRSETRPLQCTVGTFRNGKREGLQQVAEQMGRRLPLCYRS